MSRQQHNGYPVRSRVGVVLLAASSLALGACGSKGGEASTATTTPASATAEAPTSPATSAKDNYWGDAASQVPFPGRLRMPNPGNVDPCSPYGFNNPLPPIQRKIAGKMVTLFVVDARDSYPQNCDPRSDSGAYTYTEPTLHSQQQPIDGAETLPDGQVVAAEAWADGELACNAPHTPAGSRVWLKLAGTIGGTGGWTAEINTDQGATGSELSAMGIPELHFPQAVSAAVEGGCP